MNKMHELKDMLCEELDEITKKGELSAGSLDVIDKLTHSIKSIDTIIAMADAGYSNARGGGRNTRRDSMGRYSSRGYAYDDMSNNSYARRGANQYGSYDDGSEMIISELENLMREAPNEHIKSEIKKLVHKMEQM